MLTKKLEKKVSLYRNQFEKFTLQIFGDYRLSRLGLDLDALLFRIKYMNKHNKDIDKIPQYEKEFTNKASEMRSYFSKFMYQFLCDIITIPDPFHIDDIIDVFTSNVKMDSSYVTFTMTLISSNEDYLKYVDNSFSDEETFNIYPNEYFRFTTDSYNDGIAKAYPELFENRKQHEIGTGDDADIFVHSVTLQTSERCSLNCFPKGTDILMADFTHKDISEIKIGDIVLGFEENGRGFQKQRSIQLSEVVAVSSHYESCFKITHPSFEKDLYVTPEHPFFTGCGEWVMAKDIRPSDGLMMITVNPYEYYTPDIESMEYITGYFIGGWLGDGTATTGGYRTAYQTFRDYYHIRFVVKDQEMNDRMADFAEKLGFKFGNLKFKISSKYDLWRNALYSGSKEVYQKFWNLVDTTLSDINMLKNPNFLMGYAAGFFDAEGSIQGLTMRICNTDKKLLNIFEKSLQFLKLPYIYEKPRQGVNKPIYTIRLVGGIANVIKFTMSCRNVIPRKTAVHFIGSSIFRKLNGYTIEYVRDAKKVYNFETTTHTYIANRLMVHNCSYCLSGDTFIQTPNANVKKIKDIKVGDIVIGFNDDIKLSDNDDSENKVKPKRTFYNVEVLNVFKREAETLLIKSPYLKDPLRITPNHKVLTENGWMAVSELQSGKTKIGFRNNDKIIYTSSYLIYNDHEVIDVYNIETTSGTYVAAGMCVHNCYQFNKSEMRMSFDTAKEFIDHILNDDYGYVNRYNSPALILEFIGGEPLLEINLTRKIYEYFLERCYELNHPWFTMHRLSLCSNGMQYFDEDVQEFFKDYASQISFNISIDGNKELHDACRVQPNGEGSYDIDICALNHFNRYHTPERNSKMTLSPNNITYLFDSVVDFINNGMKVININCIFEEGWNNETALIEYNQLKKLANYILENNLENIYIAIFTDKQESRLGKDMDGTSCGGTGSMLAVRPNGQFYPCLRYMPTSVGPNVDDLCIGTVKDGLVGREDHSEIIDMLDHITRRSQTNDICWECPIASNCANCSALGSTVFGTPNKRTTFICIQHIAEHLANVYYWNLVKIKHPEWNLQSRRLMVPDGWSLSIIDKDELELLKYLEIKNTLDDYEKWMNNVK